MMRIRILKFGGSSLTTEALREAAFDHIKDAQNEGFMPVVVVSALGRKGDPYATDTLLQLVEYKGAFLNAREKDLLMCCGEIISASVLAALLNKKGLKSVVLTGGQAGILTESRHNHAHIIAVTPTRIEQELLQNRLVIVTGFQGISINGEITTLGRGGSDTTACALGSALHADRVDIFTDVEGVMTADPRLVSDARPLDHISYVELCQLAQLGAKVIHPRAVAIAMNARIPLRIRSTNSKNLGTQVADNLQVSCNLAPLPQDTVTSITYMRNITQISISLNDDYEDNHESLQRMNCAKKIFDLMAENNIIVDFINVKPNKIVYTVAANYAEKVMNLLIKAGFKPTQRPNCAKVSIVGAGMAGIPGVMARVVTALTMAGVQIFQSSDSHITIWVLVPDLSLKKAVLSLHQHFDLSNR